MELSLGCGIESLQVRFLNSSILERAGGYRSGDRTLAQSVFWFVHEGSFSVRVDQQCIKAHGEQLLYLPIGSTVSLETYSDRTVLVSLHFDAKLALPWAGAGPTCFGFPSSTLIPMRSCP